jgi:hypothetical protein
MELAMSNLMLLTLAILMLLALAILELISPATTAAADTVGRRILDERPVLLAVRRMVSIPLVDVLSQP